MLARNLGYVWSLFDICSIGIVFISYLLKRHFLFTYSLGISLVHDFLLAWIELIMTGLSLIFFQYFGSLVGEDFPISIIVGLFWEN